MKSSFALSFPLAAAASLLLSAAFTHAQIVIATDNFELASHPTGDRTVPAGGGIGIPFYTRNATSGNYTAGIVNDTTFGSLALNHTDTTTTAAGNAIIGLLPITISLTNPGDFIKLEFTVRFTNLGTSANNAGFRFGIFGNNGSLITADNQGTISDNDRGYYVQNGVGSAAGPGTTNTFYNEAGGTQPILGGTDRSSINTTSGAGFIFNDTDAHTVAFTITRSSATSITLSALYDAATDHAITFATNGNATNIRTSFDEIGFGDGFVASPAAFDIDNVQVSSNVPEPTTSLLALAGVALLGVRRR